MKVQEIMTGDPACCTPQSTVREAAQLMKSSDCGCIPVVEDPQTNKLVGVVTDRDLACRCLGEGMGPDTKVDQVMSKNPSCCSPGDDVEDVEKIMADKQVRRVPIIDASGCCVGIVAQADIARNDKAASDRRVGKVVEEISEPSR